MLSRDTVADCFYPRPILVVYFVVLFSISMKRQIRHMIKYKYLPFSFGKPRFGKAVRPAS